MKGKKKEDRNRQKHFYKLFGALFVCIFFRILPVICEKLNFKKYRLSGVSKMQKQGWTHLICSFLGEEVVQSVGTWLGETEGGWFKSSADQRQECGLVGAEVPVHLLEQDTELRPECEIRIS